MWISLSLSLSRDIFLILTYDGNDYNKILWARNNVMVNFWDTSFIKSPHYRFYFGKRFRDFQQFGDNWSELWWPWLPLHTITLTNAMSWKPLVQPLTLFKTIILSLVASREDLTFVHDWQEDVKWSLSPFVWRLIITLYF